MPYLSAFLAVLRAAFRTRASVLLENAALRHHLIGLWRSVKQLRFRNKDRLVERLTLKLGALSLADGTVDVRVLSSLRRARAPATKLERRGSRYSAAEERSPETARTARH